MELTMNILLTDTQQLEVTVGRFCHFISELPLSALVEQEWGPKEVLAHLVYHHELYVRLAESQVTGKIEFPPKGRFRDLNAIAVAASRGVSISELIERLRVANRKLILIYKQNDPKIIRFEIKEGYKQWTLSNLVPRVEAHIRSHLVKLNDQQIKRVATKIYEEKVM